VAELRRKTAFLEAKVGASLDGILVVDSRGQKILQNQRFNELWKIPPEIARDQHDSRQLEFVRSMTRDPEQFAAKVAHLYAHPDEVSHEEIELLDGTVLERYSSPVRDPDGNYFGRIWTFRDLTERRILEAQLRQAQKMDAVGQLAGGVAHDFNNILALILLQAGQLRLETSLSLEQLEAIRDIETAAQRAANLTRQLLLFSRKQTLQLLDLDLNETVAHLARMLERVLGEQIQMQFQYAPQPLPVKADPGMVDQILMNLTVNARDAMPAGGRLVIRTFAIDLDEAKAAQIPHARPGSFVGLSVSDNGSGIPPENLPKIFEPFFTTKPVGQGTGLGLATVFGIVHQHQGWINVFSEVGQGTTFEICLPRLVESAGLPPERLLPAALQKGHETLLLVEDEPSLRELVRAVLSRLGYHVLTAASGVEAREIWNRHRDQIQLLITDMVMPEGISGPDLARLLRQKYPELKVIFTSGYSVDLGNQELQLEEGVNFLGKPFKTAHLAHTVRKCLDQ
jgi:signal transduction histidine kinase